jgi:hypothetical protein
VYYQMAESMKQSARSVSAPFRSAPPLPELMSAYPSCPLPRNLQMEALDAKQHKRQQRAVQVNQINRKQNMQATNMQTEHAMN